MPELEFAVPTVDQLESNNVPDFFPTGSWCISKLRVCWVLDDKSRLVTDGITQWQSDPQLTFPLTPGMKRIAESLREPYDALTRADGSSMLNWNGIVARINSFLMSVRFDGDAIVSQSEQELVDVRQFLWNFLDRLNDLTGGYQVDGVNVLRVDRRPR